MPLFKKKIDPISDRARALTEEIASLEAQIRQLDAKLTSTPPSPRLRSTAVPHGPTTILRTATTTTVTTTPPPPAPAAEPIFEEVDQNRLKGKGDAEATPEHFNDLGVRKYDLAAFFQRLKNNFRGPSTSNPKLVSYLAAGSIQGLRPMRYEKRVARNRVVVLAVVFLALMVGLLFAFLHNPR